MNPRPNAVEIANVLTVLPKSKQNSFTLAYQNYLKAKKVAQCRDPTGGVYYENTKEIEETLDEVLKFLSRR